ncbi:uncharacterized protein LAESUDRAFT_742502 [Laetiporus sulphureus 93-53]|uniref:Uncharacterized protein n=1 Tax=Laetiporus sulphureus 93-53 TaxID=1314785 RepID=A0A165F501_9APHY|nr:uncharacterized protein LAESUDRAFT_742502 [Laetiporus sulphureus 93-53]KZT08402.1 hypothetical protein LAESUDRAFT_742502 [Laetiporus sulphureus 93-53]
MPTRGHRTASGLTRTHSRTSSGGGGGSKIGLNLQLTQKDVVPPPRLPDKSRKNAHVHHESAFGRAASGHHIASREHIAPVQLRRVPTPLSTVQTQESKHKVGFTISSPSEGDDDDWIESESGAATPNNACDSDTEGASTPIESNKPTTPPAELQVIDFPKEDVQTPKAEQPPVLRNPTLELPSSAPTVKDHAQPPTPPSPPPQPASQPQEPARHDQRPLQPERPSNPPAPPITKSRSATHSPSRRSPTSPTPKRQAVTRPPSTHSVASRGDGAPLRPHPLIRGHSYGPFPAKPAPLAPLTMVSSDAAQAQMSTAPSPTSLHGGSPTSAISASPDASSPASSQARRQLRRTSTSSVASSATLPAQHTASHAKGSHDRQRTMSTLSTSSSFAALSSLGIRSTPSPTRPPIRITSHFSATPSSSDLEAIHPLLPPPYLNAHMTVLAYRNPIRESYDRITRAKQAR